MRKATPGIVTGVALATLALACGSNSSLQHSDLGDAATPPATPDAIANLGTGGAPAGTGGAPTGDGGAPAGTGGAPTGIGGAPAGTGGAPTGTGGAPTGTGGAPCSSIGGSSRICTGGSGGSYLVPGLPVYAGHSFSCDPLAPDDTTGCGLPIPGCLGYPGVEPDATTAELHFPKNCTAYLGPVHTYYPNSPVTQVCTTAGPDSYIWVCPL